MRQLGQSELFKAFMSTSNANEITQTITMKLNNNIGVISPEHIQEQLLKLKTRSKTSYYALLSDALALYENRGLIRLFNLGGSGGRSGVPIQMPFVAAQARNRAKENGMEGNAVGLNNYDRVIYMNMFRIGNWNADESLYTGLAAETDLYSCLESGVIAYRLTVQNMADKVFNDKTILEYLCKIYSSLFAQALIKTKTTFGGQDFQNDAAYFIIAKFFLLYVMGKTNSDVVDDYAYLAIKNRSSLVALKSYEETSQIDYTSLSGFLNSFGQAFYNDNIKLMEFSNNWFKMYGEGTIYAVEYVPYLLHFLFAALHSASLGASSRLSFRLPDLQKMGLPKLYNAVIAAIR